jgi:hypothetical protein
MTASLGVGVVVVLASPPLWSWCLDILDARGWSHWTWTGVAMALLATLWLVHTVAKKGQNRDRDEKPAVPILAPDPRGEEG